MSDTRQGVMWSKRTQQAELPLNPRKPASHWQVIFNKYDLDNDGRISLAELRTMIMSESYENDIPAATVSKIMQRADEDRNGYLDLPEFEKLHWRRIFEMYDVNRDGRISLSELKRMLSESRNREIPANIVRQLMKMADKDQNGYLDFDEFEKMVQTKEFRGLMGHMLNSYINAAVVPRRQRRPSDVIDGTGEYEEEYTCRPPTLCMLIISILEVITFLYDVIKVGNMAATGPAASIFIYDPRKRYEAWRYFTYMFVHVGVFHLIVNLLVQILLGIPLEMVHKWWRVLLIYLAGVLAGSLGTSISDPKVFLAGASGGVYALITAHVATIIMNWAQMRFATLQLVVFFILAGSDIGTAIYNRYVLNLQDQIGYAAHLAGALAGLLVGIQILRNLDVRNWERVLWWASIILYFALMLAAIIWNAAYPEYFPIPYNKN